MPVSPNKVAATAKVDGVEHSDRIRRRQLAVYLCAGVERLDPVRVEVDSPAAAKPAVAKVIAALQKERPPLVNPDLPTLKLDARNGSLDRRKVRIDASDRCQLR